MSDAVLPKSPPGHRHWFGTFVVVSSGLVTSLLVAWLVWMWEVESGMPELGDMMQGSLPGGAFLTGILGGSGYWIGARLFHFRPTSGMGPGVVLVAVCTYLCVHALHYTQDEFGVGHKIKDRLSVAEYFARATERTMPVFRSRNLPQSDQPPWGRIGWYSLFLQIMGLSVGGFAVYAMLLNVPYCGRCSRYFTYKEKRCRQFLSKQAMDDCYASVASLLRQDLPQQGIDLLLASGVIQPKNAWDELVMVRKQVGVVVLEKCRCPECRMARLSLRASQTSPKQHIGMSVETMQKFRISFPS